MHFHALGDRAVRECLDAVAAARGANGRDGGRHHVAHLQVVDPADLARFAELGAAATIQPLWAAHEPQMDDLTIPFLGERPVGPAVPVRRPGRGRRAPGRRQRLAGQQPGPGAQGVHVAVNRVLPGARGAEAEPLSPRNRLDLGTALTAYTAGSAWVNGLDDRTGRLAAGLLADLAVLDRDPFAAPGRGDRRRPGW